MKKLPSTLKPRLKEGQRITVVGLGGVGEKVARYVAMFVASMDVEATLTLVDGDEFSPANSSRQMFSDFGNKAEVISKELLPGFVANDMKLEVNVVPEYVTPANLEKVIKDGDIVFMCVDNHASRKLVSDWCGTLKNAVLISGGCDAVEPDKGMRGSYGNVQVYIRRDGQDESPSLDLFHPEIAKPEDKLPNQLNCMERMRSSPQLLVSNIGVMFEMLAAFSLYISDALHFSEIAFDWVDGATNIVLDQDLP